VLGAPAQPVLDVLASAERYGQPLAPALERVSTEGRLERQRHNDLLARQLPVRLAFPLVCCTLPSFVLLTIAPLLAAALPSLNLHGSHP
jgi:tight adherence protein C